jgi:hypothetical protein
MHTGIKENLQYIWMLPNICNYVHLLATKIAAQ